MPWYTSRLLIPSLSEAWLTIGLLPLMVDPPRHEKSTATTVVCKAFESAFHRLFVFMLCGKGPNSSVKSLYLYQL